MTDATYPLLNLAAEIRAYCQANGCTHKQIAALAGVSHSFLDKVVAETDPIYIRRLGCIVRVLSVLGYTLADFDPRITEDKIRQACNVIRRMRDRDCKMLPMASYLGMDGGSGVLYVCLDNVSKGNYMSMAYDKAICLVHALEPDFESWCTLYAKRCRDKQELARLGGHTRSNVVPLRGNTERSFAKNPNEDDDAPMRIRQMKHRDALKMVEKSKNAKLPSDPAARKRQMFKLLKSIGFEAFEDFCTYTDDGKDPVITFTTETGLYRCEMTWNTFKSWYRKDGQEYLSTDRDIRVWHKLSNYDMAYICE